MKGNKGTDEQSFITSKRVIVAVVAAVAMVLGAMSVGAAVKFYNKIPELISGQPAMSGSSSKKPVKAQVADSETDTTQEESSAAAINSEIPPVAPTNHNTVTSPSAATVVPLPPLTPITVPAGQVTQPVVNGVQQTVTPILPAPLKDIVNGVTDSLPQGIHTGLIDVSLPKPHL